MVALAFPQFSRASEPAVVFGLTNVPLGQAVLAGNVVTNLMSNGVDGVSILLGEADGGVFAYPDTKDYPLGGDFMLAKVYGKLNGVPDQLLCTVQGERVDGPSGFGVYPVHTDFTPLGVTNYLAQVYSGNGGLVHQREIGSEPPIIRTDFNGYKLTRVNPFWRAPDGGIGVVLEFPGETGLDLDPPPDDPFVPFGTRFVLRALNPTGVVEYVSRVEITTGGVSEGSEGGTNEPPQIGISTFHMNEMRPFFFGRPHKALGEIALQGRIGQVKVARLDPSAPESENDFVEGTGVLVETGRARAAGVDLAPVDLSAENTQFGITAMVRGGGPFWYSRWFGMLGTARLRQTTNGLTLDGVFEPVGTNAQQVRLEAYRAGEVAGSSPAFYLSGSVFPLVRVSGNPRVIRAGAQANTLASAPGLGFGFDRAVTFTLTNDAEIISLEGDEVRFVSIGPVYLESFGTEAWLESIGSILLNSRGLAEFIITGEEEQSIESPRLTIARGDGEVNFSWPDPNRAYYLQGSSNLIGGNVGGPYPDYSQPIATASETVSTDEARFYRLIHAGVLD